jgi:biopolymer transport protein ExbB
LAEAGASPPSGAVLDEATSPDATSIVETVTEGTAPATAGGTGLPTSPESALDWVPGLGPALQELTDAPGVGPVVAMIGNGGPVLLILALLSVAALTIVLVKLWQYARLRIGARQPVERALALWYRDRPDEAIAALEGRRQPNARLVHRAMTGLRAPGTDEALLREELTRFGIQMQEQMRGGLRALEVIATLSPLLGLLGTVLGMIDAFRALEQAGSQVDPAILSGGIWQALLTTAAGLSVAIPVVMLHAWLERKVDAQGHRMDDAVTRVFTRDLGTVSIGKAEAQGSAADAEPEAPDHAA